MPLMAHRMVQHQLVPINVTRDVLSGCSAAVACVYILCNLKKTVDECWVSDRLG